jgi:methylamine--corrinoid protein Co-methyltransferase
MTTGFLDILERSRTGKTVKKEDWDFEGVVMTTRSLVSKYEIKWDSQEIIPLDDALVDRVFQAALELAEMLGVYNVSTGKAIRFSRDEIEEGLQNAPRELVFGEGDEARVLHARKVQDTVPPAVWAGNPGVPTPEDIFQPMVMSWMKEPIVDLATCGSMVTYQGHPVVSGEPEEVYATRNELTLLREGLRKVGRPGMGLLAAQSSVSELGDLCVMNPGFLRPTDAHLVPMLNELMIDRGSLVRAANGKSYGARNASLACVMIGGLAGNAPGAAVVQAASFMLANLVCQADYHLLHPIHIRHVATSTRGVMWVEGVVSRAFARNSPAIIVADIFPKSGAMTKELLYEVAANAAVISCSSAHLEGVGAADGALPNGTGLEVRWMGEVGHAVTRQGLNYSQANELVSQLLQRYESIFSLPEGNPGVRFDEAYNVETLEPVSGWQRMYDEVKHEVRKLGLEV